MTTDQEQQHAVPEMPAGSPTPRSLRRRVAMLLALMLGLYFLLAYAILPFAWLRYSRRHPSLDDLPGITHTAAGVPGDPLNVGLIGTAADVKRIMSAAKWDLADALGLRSDLKIAADTVLDRSYDDAPVSRLYWDGRQEDLAFEQPVGDNPQHRHHVRFWCTKKLDPDGRPLWLGSATYDQSVGLSHTTGQITHHIAADVDAERDHVFATIEATQELTESYRVPGFHQIREGRNGGGDPWYTDGDLRVGVVAVP